MEFDAECSRGLEVDDELEFARLHDRKFSRLFAFDDATRVNARLPECVGEDSRHS